MALLNIVADLSGLTQAVNDNTAVQVRIAEALERISPPISAPSGERSEPDRVSGMARVPNEPTMAESVEEYESRLSWERQFAMDLGFAPDSPQVLELLRQMRSDLSAPRIVTDEEGNDHTVTLSDEEALQSVRDAFQEAISQQNTRG